MSDKNLKIIFAVAIGLAVVWFLTRTRQGNAMVNRAGELFPQIAPYLPVYEGGDVIVNLEQPQSSNPTLPAIEMSGRKDNCYMCGVSDNVDNLLPAGEMAQIGALSGTQVIDHINWYGETDALYKIAMNANPDLIFIEPK